MDLIAIYRILIKHDRVAELTIIELRNKKIAYQGQLFSLFRARRKDKAKDQVFHVMKNAMGT